jgi:glycosyltransferase involved in cell wall biosynthesis
MSGLVSHFGSVVGTFHPRWGDALLEPYRNAGIKVEPRFEEVMKRASVFITDNSSAGWEAMALGIPVVWLNAPWYRRDVEHGLRFWEFANAGIEVDEPAALVAGVELALEDPVPVQRRRREAVKAIYGSLDGKAAHRAARAIEEME